MVNFLNTIMSVSMYKDFSRSRALFLLKLNQFLCFCYSYNDQNVLKLCTNWLETTFRHFLKFGGIIELSGHTKRIISNSDFVYS